MPVLVRFLLGASLIMSMTGCLVDNDLTVMREKSGREFPRGYLCE